MIDQSIGPFFYEFRLWKTGLLISIVRSVICFFFFLFSFIYSVIHSTFLNCLTVATNVLGRTHTLNGTTVEISRHSITDEFQAKDGSRDQVRPTTDPFKLGSFLILTSVLVVKFYLTF